MKIISDKEWSPQSSSNRSFDYFLSLCLRYVTQFIQLTINKSFTDSQTDFFHDQLCLIVTKP